MYGSLSPAEAHQLGQQLYRQKKYEAALEAFSTVSNVIKRTKFFHLANKDDVGHKAEH